MKTPREIPFGEAGAEGHAWELEASRITQWQLCREGTGLLRSPLEPRIRFLQRSGHWWTLDLDQGGATRSVFDIFEATTNLLYPASQGRVGKLDQCGPGEVESLSSLAVTGWCRSSTLGAHAA